MFSETLIAQLAAELNQAEKTRTQVEHFSKRHPQMTIEDGYAISKAWVALKIKEGRIAKGHKIGLTSRAMQQSSQINEPDYGTLLDDMFFPEGSDIPFNRFIAPRVEVELAFVLGKRLQGPNVTIFDVLAATDYVVPAMEIIDSRIRDWKIGLLDTIADNASSGGIVLGSTPVAVDSVDLRLSGCVMTRNGEVATTGAGGTASSSSGARSSLDRI